MKTETSYILFLNAFFSLVLSVRLLFKSLLRVQAFLELLNKANTGEKINHKYISMTTVKTPSTDKDDVIQLKAEEKTNWTKSWFC